MYPKFLMHNERSYYIKINNSDGDGIFINYNMEIISTQDQIFLKELNELAPMELIEEGYIAIEKNLFSRLTSEFKTDTLGS